MKIWIQILFSILLFQFGYTQEKKDSLNIKSLSPYNSKGVYQTWSIRGKILPYPLGNSGGINFTAGIEFGFCKNHSISIDGIFDLLSGIDDHLTDTSGVYHDAVKIEKDRYKGIFISYRYYLDFPKLRENKGLSLYTSTYLRYGTLSTWHDGSFSYNTTLSSEEINYSGGILIGSIYNFQRKKRCGIDFNIGPFYKQKYTTTIFTENKIVKTKDDITSNFGLRVGVNLCWWFYRKKNLHS